MIRLGRKASRSRPLPAPRSVPRQSAASDSFARSLAAIAELGTPPLARQLIEAVPIPAYITDAAGCVLLLNRAAAGLLGLDDPTAAIGMTLAAAASPEPLTAAEPRAMESGTPLATQRDYFPGPPGVLPEVVFTQTPVRDAAGQVVGIVGTAPDPTRPPAAPAGSATLAELALRESEARFRAVWEATADAIALSDPAGIVLAVNPAYCNLCGYPAAELVGRGFAEIYLTGERAAAEARYRSLFADAAPPSAYKFRIRRGDGAIRDVETHTAFVERDGERVALVSTMRDITDRRRIEAELRQEQERFRGAFEAAAIGMALVSPDGRYLRVNRALCDILGYGEAEMLGLTFQELTHPDDLETDVELRRRLVAGEISTFQLEKRYLRRDGSIAWGHLAVSLVRDRNGAVRHLIAQIEDVTPRKAAEAATAEALARLEATNLTLEATNRELERQSQAKSAFVSVVSHELRTPLTSIQGFSELICTEVDTLELAQSFALTINQSSERLNRLIRNVLDLDRMEHGRVELSVAPVNVNQLITIAMGAFGSPPKHRVELVLDPQLPLINGDPDRLTQVVTNLVANAIKYSPAGGDITIATRTHSETIELTVADEGLGIPPEYLESIFDPYVQISRPEQLSIEGTGLGLPITQQIVKLHAGRIWVEPNLPHGSIFHVVLPVPVAPAADESIRSESLP